MYACIYWFKLFSIPMNKKNVILSVTVKINLPLKLQTDHFFVSVGKRTKSAGDQICFPPTVYVLSGIWNIELLLLPQHWGTLFFSIIKFNCKVMSLCLLSRKTWTDLQHLTVLHVQLSTNLAFNEPVSFKGFWDPGSSNPFFEEQLII